MCYKLLRDVFVIIETAEKLPSDIWLSDIFKGACQSKIQKLDCLNQSGERLFPGLYCQYFVIFLVAQHIEV